MKRLILLLIVLALPAGFVAAQQTAPKLSPLTRMYLQSSAKSEGSIVPGYVYKTFNGKYYISALIKVSSAISDEALQDQGVLVGTKAGSIWTVQIPVAGVNHFTRTPGISYIQLDEPVHQALDSARKATRVDSVQGGAGLKRPFFGKGVVVGIIDAGFDYSSPALWDTGGNYYRVKRVWAQKATGGTPPSGFIYGAEMTDSNTLITAGTDQSSMSHGTHVVGIAAGSGFGSGAGNNIRFRGMAPLSDIVLVGIMPQQQQWINGGGADVIDGAHYIYSYAQSVGKPCVINLSWGTSIGAHDGSSLFSQALEALCGPGKIFVTSAGNDGGVKGHVQKTFSASDTLVHTFVTCDPAVRKTWADIWGDSAKYFKVKVTLYNGSAAGASTGFVAMDGLVHNFPLIGSSSDTCFISMTADSADYNGKPHTFISVYNKVADSICISVLGKSGGTVNMWNRYVEAPNGYEAPFTNGGKSWAVAGDTVQSISDNASGKSCVTVGAYAAKVSWRTYNNATYNYSSGTPVGAIAPFSSIGPSSDNRMKPDITGPGYGVVSAVNSYDAAFAPGGASYSSSVVYNYLNPANNRTYRYAILAGTSMSSPAVTGIIALLLEANPGLTPQQMISVLQQTAIRDNYTGAAMNNTWGGGKVNAYAALKQVLQTNSVGGPSQQTLASHIFPNPGNGEFSIGLLMENAQQMRVTVYDIAGRCVLTEGWNASGGYSVHSLSLKDAPKGVYLAKITGKDGSNSVLRFAVQ